MDNQQINLINDNYFAGLIDSDFGVYLTMNTYKGKLNLRPRITFVNTRFCLVEVCSDKLKANGINHHISTEKATVGRDHKRIQILRLDKCLEFVDKWLKMSIVRQEQLQLLRDFCIERLTYVEGYGWKYNNTPYTDSQKNIFNAIQELNSNYNRDSGNRNYTFSWLAGMVDGDGSIYFSDTHRDTKYKDKVYSYRKVLPALKITTESHTALNNIKEMYDKHGVNYFVESVRGKISKKFVKNKYKFHYNIVVNDFNSLLVLLNNLNGKLIAKQKQLELMIQYIEAKQKDRKYNDYVYSIVDEVKTLNTVY